MFLSVGNSLKTCILFVDLGKALVTHFPVEQIHVHSNFKPVDLQIALLMLLPVQQIHSNLNRFAKTIEDILGYHKTSFDTINMLVTKNYRFLKIFFLSVLHNQTSVESL